jgi:hypothetical protein
MASLGLRATRIAIVLPMACLIAHAFACDGPQPDDAACVAAGGECLGSDRTCYGTLPSPCAQGVCCVPGQSAPAGQAGESPADASSVEAGMSSTDAGAE